MGNPPITPPPQATDVGDVAPDKKERVLKGVGGFITGIGGNKMSGSPLDRAIEQHHQQRLSDVNRYRSTAATMGARKALIESGTNPDTHQKFDDPAYKGPSKDEMWTDANKNYKEAWDAYIKTAGVNKDTKAALARSRDAADKLIALRGQQGTQGGGPQPPPKAAATNAPPAAAAAPAGGSPAPGTNLSPPPKVSPEGTATSSGGYPITGAGGPNMTPPPQAAATGDAGGNGGGGGSAGAGPTADELSLQAPRLQAGMDASAADDRQYAQFERQQTLLKNFKIEEQDAKAKADAAAKAANPSGRPVMGPATSVRNARELAKEGKTFEDINGSPIDLTTLPDSMGLKFIAWGGKHYYEPFSPNQRAITVGNETYAVSPMDMDAIGQGAGKDLGQHNVGSTTKTTDPTTGQTTVATHMPGTTGAKGAGMGGGGTAAPAPKSSARPSTAKSSGDAAAPPQLDSTGHVPDSASATPQVIEGANQLIDGRDVDKIPAKTKELSAALARKYGWSQDKFTPLEKTQVALATRYIQEMRDSPALKTLDASFWHQLPMMGAAGDPSKEGFFARLATKASAMNTTPAQAEFLRMYRQVVGTISGLGKLSRGGRITEATVNRLLRELPDPNNTKNSADAIARLDRFNDEVKTALSHDSFEELSTGRSAKPTTKTGPPPKAGASESSGVIKWTRDKDGNPVQASQ